MLHNGYDESDKGILNGIVCQIETKQNMEQLDIRQLIGEATEYDKKEALEVKKPKSWCKSVSAFVNGIGGKLVWGIADDDTLVGLADAKGDSEKISEAIKSHIDPIPDFKLSFAKCENKEFVVLDVMPGAQTPYYYIGDGQMQAFVRVGNESVVASVAKHKELVLKGPTCRMIVRCHAGDLRIWHLPCCVPLTSSVPIVRSRIAITNRSASSMRRVN